MERLMKYRCRLFSVVFCLIFGLSATAHALNVGDPFPDFSVDNTLSKEQSAYLKIPHNKPVQLSALPHDVVIIEFLNVYCHTCRVQVPIFNELKKAIDDDPDLRGRVCMLGFAVGNSVEEIETFKNDFGALYPILSDKDKVLFERTGNIRGTPHTYVVKRTDLDFIVDYHAGGVSSAERYVESIRHILRSSLEGNQAGNKIVPLTFKAGWRTVTTEKLSGGPYMLYFASSAVRTVAQDLRNMAAQLSVLESISGDIPVKIFVFPPADKDFDTPDIPEPLVKARDTKNAARELLGFVDQPGLVFVNKYGRIIYRGESITLLAARQLVEGREYILKPGMSSEQIQELIRRHVSAAGYQVAEMEHVMLENRQSLYVITVAPQGSGVFFFARVESGITMCDVCHDTHFVYMFDQAGIVTDFFPLEITKYGNIAWTDEDSAKIKNSLAGRSIFETFDFNPKVDAVTTATMSSSIVYESMNRAKEYFNDFYDYSFRAPYWQKQCFSVICKVKRLVQAGRQNPDFVFDDSSLQQIMKDNALRGCPTGGMYIVLDDDVLCSQHGMNMHGCGQ
jgi:thiol-disulfide isomerase/thioredoxin